MDSPRGDDDPICLTRDSTAVEMVIEGRPRDLGGFSVRRVVPSPLRRSVGPFVFFDHMGPAELAAGTGMDVRPHPHIALATVTFLFDGEIDHRDSLGTFQTIRPGDVNWMVAGRGIVHSERSGEEARRRGSRIHGIQSWVALPLDREEAEPRFEHHPRTTIPRIEVGGAIVDVVAGTAYGARSPVAVLSDTLYVHATLPAGARMDVDEAHEERAVYVVEGSIGCASEALGAGAMAILKPGAHVTLVSSADARVILVGGASVGPRFIEWNFVSSSKDRIQKAKDDWQNGRFAKVPGDEIEFIPLPT